MTSSNDSGTAEEQDKKLASKITTLTAKLMTDLQSHFTASKPLAILAHYDIEFTKLIALERLKVSKIENESMKASVEQGYTLNGRDWCGNHDKHVSQCYACKEAKWGNIFCKKFEVIIDERIAELDKQIKELSDE